MLSLSDGATAIPDEIGGDNTGLAPSFYMDELFVDHRRNMIYVAVQNGTVLVFDNADTAIGNIAPSRSIKFGASFASGIEVDVCRDILYVTGNNSGGETHIWKFDKASTLQGTVTPDAYISTLPTAVTLSIDNKNDRLYVGGDYDGKIYIYDEASGITNDVAPTAVINYGVSSGPSHVWADEKNDRLYVSSNSATPGGNYVFALENASMLTTGIINADTDSSMRIADEAIAMMIDPLDNLYIWPDSATAAHIYFNVGTLTGDVTPTADLTINGVVQAGYGISYMLYR